MERRLALLLVWLLLGAGGARKGKRAYRERLARKDQLVRKGSPVKPMTIRSCGRLSRR